MRHRLCPERSHESIRAYLHKEREAYFRKNIAVEATPARQSRSSRTEWDSVVASSGYDKLFSEETVELK